MLESVRRGLAAWNSLDQAAGQSQSRPLDREHADPTPSRRVGLGRWPVGGSPISKKHVPRSEHPDVEAEPARGKRNPQSVDSGSFPARPTLLAIPGIGEPPAQPRLRSSCPRRTANETQVTAMMGGTQARRSQGSRARRRPRRRCRGRGVVTHSPRAGLAVWRSETRDQQGANLPRTGLFTG